MTLAMALGDLSLFAVAGMAVLVMLSGFVSRGPILGSASMGMVSGIGFGYFAGIPVHFLGAAAWTVNGVPAYGHLAALIGAVGGILPVCFMLQKDPPWNAITGVFTGVFAGSVTATLAVKYGMSSDIVMEWFALCALCIVVEIFGYLVLKDQ